MVVAPIQELNPERLILIEFGATFNDLSTGNLAVGTRDEIQTIAEGCRRKGRQRVIGDSGLAYGGYDQAVHTQASANLQVQKAEVDEQVQRLVNQTQVLRVVASDGRRAAEQITREGHARRLQAGCPGQQCARQGASGIARVEPLQANGEYRVEAAGPPLRLQGRDIQLVLIRKRRLFQALLAHFREKRLRRCGGILSQVTAGKVERQRQIAQLLGDLVSLFDTDRVFPVRIRELPEQVNAEAPFQHIQVERRQILAGAPLLAAAGDEHAAAARAGLVVAQQLLVLAVIEDQQARD